MITASCCCSFRASYCSCPGGGVDASPGERVMILGGSGGMKLK
jgi:hypothetical protein